MKTSLSFLLGFLLISGSLLIEGLSCYSTEDNVTAPSIKKTIKPVTIKSGIYEVTGTYYNPVVAQCDDNPLQTADNSHIDLQKLKEEGIRWVALSRDLLKRWGGPYDYGDTLYVYHPHDKIRGTWVIHDCMNKRYKNRIDFLVASGNKFIGVAEHILISNRMFYSSRN